jgi:4-hydroxy-3-methylbut-2-enyl diphosphate reductase
MLVVGSANSSNSARLAEVAEKAGAGRSHLIDDVSRIDPGWLAGVTVVGVTSGASVPEHLVGEVVSYLASSGYAEVEQYRCVEEKLTFSLPPQVRR